MFHPRPEESSVGPAKAPEREQRVRGFTLIESVITLAIIALSMTLAVPSIVAWSDAHRLDLAAAEVVGALRRARAYAIKNNANVGIKFFPSDSGATFGIYRDTDDDGVRSDDIQRGIDVPIVQPRPLSYVDGRVFFGFPDGLNPRDPSGGGRLGRLNDPIRFNRSDIASFAPLGTATPGTIYLSNNHHLVAVRVLNRSGKVAIKRYDRRNDQWE